MKVINECKCGSLFVRHIGHIIKCPACLIEESITKKFRRLSMSTTNIKIIAEVNGKQVPLEIISTETFEAIKALEKPKEIPVARLAFCSGIPRLLFKPTYSIMLDTGTIYALDLKHGTMACNWAPNQDENIVKQQYKEIVIV